MMTEIEAKEWLKHTRAYQHKCDNCEYIDIKGACNEECKDFYDMAIKALEKQIPKKPIEVDEECGTFDCPACGSTICSFDDMTVHQYCLMCGQKLDWE